MVPGSLVREPPRLRVAHSRLPQHEADIRREQDDVAWLHRRSPVLANRRENAVASQDLSLRIRALVAVHPAIRAQLE